MEINETTDPHTLVGAQIIYRIKYAQRLINRTEYAWGSEKLDTVTEISEPFPGQFQVVTEQHVRLRWGTDSIRLVRPAAPTQYADEIARLGNGGTVRIGDEGEFGFWTGGGLEINLSYGVQAGCGVDHEEECDGPLSDDDIRKAVALLTAYLALKDEEGKS